MIRPSLVSMLVVCAWLGPAWCQQLSGPTVGGGDVPQPLPPVESRVWPETAVPPPDPAAGRASGPWWGLTWLDAAPILPDAETLAGSIVPQWSVAELLGEEGDWAGGPAAEMPAAKTPAEEPSASGEDEAGGKESGEEPVPVEKQIPTAWYYAPVVWLNPWDGNVEVGVSGSEGNTQTLNYLVGLDAKREREYDVLHFDMKYDRKTANSVKTAHRLFSEIRWELLAKESPWTWFFHETTEYDEFKAFDLRLSYDTGLGRRLIKNETTSLLARIGAGTSHEIGGSNDNLVPEAVFGMEFTHTLNDRQKLSASSEYAPDVTDFLDYRLRSKAAWEMVLDEKTNLSLKLSVLNRYDSTPDGMRPNDLDYTLTLLWSF